MYSAYPAAFKMQGEEMERIKTSTRVVGLKQTKKAVDSGRAEIVYIAKDADGHVVIPLEKMCEGKIAEVVYVESMKELGKACHVDVPTAVAAIVKDA